MMLCALASASAMTGSIASHKVALPALKFGGEWAGQRVMYSSDTGAVMSTAEVLTVEQWNPDRRMERHVWSGPGSGRMDELPLAQSGSEVLTLGARMLEPEVLNIRSWALDAVDDANPQYWQIETILDGWCGDRPTQRVVSLECPKERTRVQFAFDPTSGTFDSSSPMVVFQERCWSVSPAGNLDARDSAG